MALRITLALDGRWCFCFGEEQQPTFGHAVGLESVTLALVAFPVRGVQVAALGPAPCERQAAAAIAKPPARGRLV